MELNDNENNITFSPVFVKKFSWHDPIDNEKFEGHPMVGRVYRVAYNKDTKSYRVFYQDKTGRNVGIYLPELERSGEGYESSISIITRKNILDFEFTEEDLGKVEGWLSTDHADLKASMGFYGSPIKDISELLSSMTTEREDPDTITEFLSNSKRLYSMYPLMFEALNMVISHIDSYDTGESLDGIALTFSKEHGAGYNVGKALECLGTYMSDDKRISLAEEDLLNAIVNLLNEETRIITHNLE